MTKKKIEKIPPKIPILKIIIVFAAIVFWTILIYYIGYSNALRDVVHIVQEREGVIKMCQLILGG